MLLVTTWFGSFLLDEGKVVEARLFPKDPAALADRLMTVEDWKPLPEERDLMASVDEVFVVEPRLERVGGRMTSERAPFLDPAAHGYEGALLHAAMIEVAKRQMRRAIRPEDHLHQAIAAMDDLQREENLISERLREWYGLHFPELARTVDDRTYLELIVAHGRRDRMPVEGESVGADLGEPEEREVRGLAELVGQIRGRRVSVEAYVERAILELAPNVADLAGPIIAARLVTLAGGVEDLARAPAGTIQLLGAEKALFRHLRTGARPPKHGVLFLHPFVHGAPPWQRGAIARAFAAKIALAARADAFTHRRIGPDLARALTTTIEDIRRRKEKRPTRPRARAAKEPRSARGRTRPR